MAKLLSRQQRIQVGVKNPVSVYSRVVSCGTKVVGAGVSSFGYTHPVGQDVRLLKVQLFIEPVAYAAGLFLLVRVLTGFGQPDTAAAILNWENVLPMLQEPNIDTDIMVHSGRRHMSWDMSVLHTGVGRRFGIWTRGMIGMTGPAFASFEVTEG